MKLKNIGEKILTFIVDHKDILIKSAVAVGVVSVSAKYNLPMSFGGIEVGKMDTGDYEFKVTNRANAEEEGIISLANSIKTMSFDSNKKEVAKKIRDIALKSVSDDTKKTAIGCLEKIADKMDFSSSKSTVSNYIYDIIMKGEKG